MNKAQTMRKISYYSFHKSTFITKKHYSNYFTAVSLLLVVKWSQKAKMYALLPPAVVKFTKLSNKFELFLALSHLVELTPFLLRLSWCFLSVNAFSATCCQFVE